MIARAVAALGDKQIEAEIREAERTEAEHLTKVRAWPTAAAALVTKQTDS